MFCVRQIARRAISSVSAAALVSASLPISAYADTLPSNGRVAAGSATIGTPTNGAMTITQSSDRAVINWNSFSIGAGNAVTFAQPSSGSAVLNRVTGDTTSTIAGKLSANGQVFLVNPNGIAITSSGVVDVGGGFVASSLNIRKSDFMDGNLTFSGIGGAVSNAGSISVGTGGFAALLGGSVSNSGRISVPTGRIGLGASTRATLDLTGDGFLQVAAPGVGGAGGAVNMTGAQVRNAVRNVVNIPGSATTVSGHHGRIVFGNGGRRYAAASKPVHVADAGSVVNSGTLSASGGKIELSGTSVTVDHGTVSTASATAKGGSIVVSATDSIKLLSASLDASGRLGGGSIKVGGDFQGTGTLIHAQGVTLDADSTLRADATGAGKGGDIVVWSDGRTTVKGLLTAMGAGAGFNGGMIETSGHTVDFTGVRVNASSAGGHAGTWLVDPFDLTVDAAAAATIASNLANADVTLQTSANGASGPGVTNANGSGDVFINSGITWSSANTLQITAFRNITLNAAIAGSNGGLKLSAAGLITTGTGGSVDIGTFSLSSGTWSQIGANNAAFSVKDFQIQGGTFIRAIGGDGSTATPYQVADIYGLQGIGSAGMLGLSYVLANDIDATGTKNWWAGLGFTSIGGPSGSPYFTGSFDGRGHVVSGLFINRPTEDFIGLFGIASNATIRNVGMVGGSVTGNNYVGALVGFHRATTTSSIAGTYASTAVVGFGDSVGGLVGVNMARSGATASITGSYATGTVTGYGSNVGGLVGANYGLGGTASISTSYATGGVQAIGDPANGAGYYVGGLVGHNSGDADANRNVGVGSITNAYATGSVTGYSAVGGLVGLNFGNSGTASITNTYATGLVTATNPMGAQGGLVGGSLVNSGSVSVTASFYDSQTTGQSDTDRGIGLDSTQMKNPFIFINAGWNFASVWGKSFTGANSGYMMLQALSTGLYAGYVEAHSSGPFVGGFRVYGDSNDTISGLSFTGIGANDLKYVWSVDKNTNVGFYGLAGVLTLTNAKGVPVYSNLPGSEFSLVITPRPIVVTADNQSRAQGAPNPQFTYTIGGRGLVLGDTLDGTLSTSATSASPVGTYAIGQGTLRASPNYILTFVNGQLTVTAAPAWEAPSQVTPVGFQPRSGQVSFGTCTALEIAAALRRTGAVNLLTCERRPAP